MADLPIVADKPNESIARLILSRIDRKTILAIIVTLALVFITGILIFHEMPEKSKELLFLLIGALIVLTKDAFGYDFSTTAGSSAKDDTIKQAALAILPPPDTKV